VHLQGLLTYMAINLKRIANILLPITTWINWKRALKSMVTATGEAARDIYSGHLAGRSNLQAKIIFKRGVFLLSHNIF
jgi:hypothetical protein